MDKNLIIVVGHYGSGKTEFSINYAVKSKETFKKVNLVDLDIVNPYFRSREKREILENMDISIMASNLTNKNLDIPALSPSINGAINDIKARTIIDAGGDPVGAKALSRYNNIIRNKDYDMFLVVNANRQDTQNLEKVISYYEKIEATSRLKITGLINNTHTLKSTSIEDVMRGAELVKKVSEKLKIPVKYHTAIKKIADEINKNKSIEVFPIELYMREKWMY